MNFIPEILLEIHSSVRTIKISDQVTFHFDGQMHEFFDFIRLFWISVENYYEPQRDDNQYPALSFVIEQQS